MFKEVLRSVDTGVLGIIGLVAFFVAFLLIVVRVMTMKRSEREDAKQIPLGEDDTNLPDSARENASAADDQAPAGEATDPQDPKSN